jgi:hypothetical protein
MKENKLTPEEIKKTLECCSDPEADGCLHCPLFGSPVPECGQRLCRESLELLNSQQVAFENSVKATKHWHREAELNAKKIISQQAEIERLQTENNQFADIGKMDSEIRAEANLETSYRGISKDIADGCRFFKNKADFVEVKHGEWVLNRHQAPDEKSYFCSLCAEGGSDYSIDNYCLNCGADMRKGGADNG